MLSPFPQLRLRRLRSHPALQSLIREVSVDIQDLVFPLFIKGQKGDRNPITSMPGIDQLPLSHLAAEAKELSALGLGAVILFGVPSYKDATGSGAISDQGIVQEAIRIIREAAPDLLVTVDLCLCEYTDHGHCGVLCPITGHIDNDKTLELLGAQAVSLAKAGAQVIAPSGMMDGAIVSLRQALDSARFTEIPLLSYSVKYNSALYGPFRDAAEGAPHFGDRSSHQMDPANAREALREAALDVEEGADLLMVKPAHAYLDVIYRIKQAYPSIPLGAYHTSGEFAMIKAAAQRGWIDEKRTVLEILGGIKRAGADFIITYYAKQLALWKNL